MEQEQPVHPHDDGDGAAAICITMPVYVHRDVTFCVWLQGKVHRSYATPAALPPPLCPLLRRP